MQPILRLPFHFSRVYNPHFYINSRSEPWFSLPANALRLPNCLNNVVQTKKLTFNNNFCYSEGASALLTAYKNKAMVITVKYFVPTSPVRAVHKMHFWFYTCHEAKIITWSPVHCHDHPLQQQKRTKTNLDQSWEWQIQRLRSTILLFKHTIHRQISFLEPKKLKNFCLLTL